jgi:hypothetical protein
VFAATRIARASRSERVISDEPEAAVWFGAVLAEPANLCDAEKLLLMLSRMTFAERRESLRVPLVSSDASVIPVSPLTPCGPCEPVAPWMPWMP